MSHFLDTSVVVSALVEEPKTIPVRAWLEAQRAGELFISDWVITEVSSALSIKLRTGRIDADLRSAALGVFHRLMAAELTVAPVRSAHFRTAATLADRHELGIRGGDALHLAVSSALGATLATLDQNLAAAAPMLGVPAVLL